MQCGVLTAQKVVLQAWIASIADKIDIALSAAPEKVVQEQETLPMKRSKRLK